MYATYVPSVSEPSPFRASSAKPSPAISPSQNRLVEPPLAQQSLKDENGSQPFLLFAERIVARADTLRLILQEQTQELLSSRKLCMLLQWATQVAQRSEENLDACAKRAEALSLAINRASQLARGLARGNYRVSGVERANNLDTAAQYAHAIASKLDDRIVRGEKSSVGRAFIDRAVATWYDGEFDPSILNLTQSETQALKDLLYVNYLIVQCHALTATVSAEAWHDIQHRMLQLNYED
jgi:hypothetical protein